MSELLDCVAFKKPVEEIKILLEAGASVNDKNNKGYTALHLCANHLQSVDLPENIGPEWHVKKNEESQAWDLNVLKLLIEYGADVNMETNSCMTPLSLFVANGARFDIVEILLSRTASIDRADKFGNTALHYYSRHRKHIRPDLLKIIVDKHFDIDIKNNKGYTPFLLFVFYGCPIEHIRILLQAGADVCFAESDTKFSVLHTFAIGYKNLNKDSSSEVLSLLLDKGADVFHLNNRKITPLIEFVFENLPIELIKILFSKVINVNETLKGRRNLRRFMLNTNCLNNTENLRCPTQSEVTKAYVNYVGRGITALNCLATCSPLNNGDASTINLLIKNGADVNLKTENGRTPLHVFLDRMPREDIINMLIENGADVNLTDKNGNTALHLYCRTEHVGYETNMYKTNLNLLQTIIKKHTDINMVNNFGNTTLMCYFERTSLDCTHIEALLDAGASVNVTTRSGNSLIHIIAGHCRNYDSISESDFDGTLGILKLLIKKGADVNLLDQNGLAPVLQFLSNRCDVDYVDTLLDSGADVNAVDRKGRTILHYCTRYKPWTFDLLNRFLYKFDMIDCQDTIEQETPLMGFVKAGFDDEAIDVILSLGCNVNLTNSKGRTVLHYCAKNKNISIDILNKIINKVNNINVLDENGYTPLMSFILEGSRVDYIDALLNAGADVNCTDIRGNSILHLFADVYTKHNTDLNVLNLMIRSGAPTNTADHEGTTVLMKFLNQRVSLECLMLILDKGVDVSEHGYLFYIVHISTFYEYNDYYCDALKLLLEYGCDPNRLDDKYCDLGSRKSVLEFSISHLKPNHPISWFIMMFNYGARFHYEDNAEVLMDISKTFFFDTQMKHLAVLKCTILDGYLDNINLNVNNIFYIEELQSYVDRLKNEVNKMKTLMFGKVTVHTFLMETDLQRLGLYLLQCGSMLPNLKTKLPFYIELIEAKIQIATCYADLRKAQCCLTISVRTVGKEVVLNPDCVMEVCRFLSLHDVLKLQRALKQ